MTTRRLDVDTFRHKRTFLACVDLYFRRREKILYRLYHVPSLDAYMLRASRCKELHPMYEEDSEPYCHLFGYGRLSEGKVVEDREPLTPVNGDILCGEAVYDTFLCHRFCHTANAFNAIVVPVVLHELVCEYVDATRTDIVEWSTMTATPYWHQLRCNAQGQPLKPYPKWPHCRHGGPNGERTDECWPTCIHGSSRD